MSLIYVPGKARMPTFYEPRMVREPRLMVPNQSPNGRLVLSDRAKALGLRYAWAPLGTGQRFVVSDSSSFSYFNRNAVGAFDGTYGAIDLGNPGELNITGQIFLFARHTFEYLPGFRVLVARGYDGSNEGFFLRYVTGSSSLIECGTYVSGVTHSAIWNIPDFAFGVNDVVNAAGLFDGSTWRMFVNGKERGSGGSIGASSTTARSSIGGEQISQYWPQRNFCGRIELVYVGVRGSVNLPPMLERDPWQFLSPD